MTTSPTCPTPADLVRQERDRQEALRREACFLRRLAEGDTRALRPGADLPQVASDLPHLPDLPDRGPEPWHPAAAVPELRPPASVLRPVTG